MKLAEPATREAMAAAAAAWVVNELSGQVVGRKIEEAAAGVLAGAPS